MLRRVVVLCAACAVLAACGGDGGGKTTIGVTFTSLKFPVFVFMQRAIEEEAARDGIEVVTVSANENASDQLKAIENMLNRGVDAMIVNAVDERSIVSAIRRCNEKGVPVVLLDRMSEGGDYVAYVTADSREVGRMQARFVAERLGGRGRVVILEGTTGNSVARDITAGNLEVLAQFPGMEVVRRQDCNWERGRALAFMENTINTGVAFDAVLANNDTMIMGAVQALQNAGLTDVITVGADADKDALEAIRSGQLTATVDKMPIEMAKKAYEVAVRTLRGEEVPVQVIDGVKTIFTPSRMITADSVDLVTRWKDWER